MIHSKFALAIHGGAGTIKRLKMLPEMERSYKEVLSLSLLKGQSILSSGGSAMEAVVSSIQVLEDSPLFNAGKGSVFTNDEIHELDASIMDGQTLKAGAVAGLKVVKNPIKAAYAVLNRNEHVFLVGEGGDKFAKENGCEIVENSYFSTEHRKKQLDRLKAIGIEKTALDHNVDVDNKGKIGTVGAVALDKYGRMRICI